MFVSAQAPLYLFSSAPVYIYRELGGIDHWIWFITAHLLVTAVVSPFVGALSDVFGRRWVALLGSIFIIIGQVICGTAHGMDIFIGGMALSGIGVGINELTAIAGTAELVPTSQRGYYIAVIVLAILPFMPSVLYAQLIASRYSWRYIALLTSGTALAGLVMTFLFYKPPTPSALARGKKTLLRKTDLTGGLLSIIGLTGLELGLLGGGYQHPWGSVHVLAPLIIGILFIAFFVIWEFWVTENPMLPRRLGKAPRTLILTLVITSISGAEFFSVLMLWPPEAYNVYGHDPIGVGIRGLPFALGTLAGCFISLVLISRLGGANIRYTILGAAIIMTAGCGSLVVARPDNISTVYPILFLAGLGVGGLIVPPSTMATFICPSDLIATITAMTIAVRIVGGAVGYAVYYNVFANKLGPALMVGLGEACAKVGITDLKVVGGVVGLTATGLIPELEGLLTKVGVDEAGRQMIVATGQAIYADVYPWVFYCSIAFGGVAILASMFLEDISVFIDDNVAVVI
ncbi:major facilitator superfamily domain-containing protein [Lasiosphaeris hirsuta]|uniref:Major facilitator superfamily domain-containing protein n=1 Tax=Lasiosphaeris hirsuta TaxID=260670 RepID=A0AA40B8Q2_9PEZI|nr:major facilitator superfamily domain-containing protein [Lasiosphaeris hirsuta]